MKPHKWAVEIHAFADGHMIQGRSDFKGSEWFDIRSPDFGASNFEYRVKPAEPERSYPQSMMKRKEFALALGYEGDAVVHEPSCEAVANAALRHACDNGQIVTREEFDRAVGDRAKRDMAVAAAVCYASMRQGGPEFRDQELQNIIKGVTNV